ncbi:17.3 kDa class II heat shock protein isoform X2 [Macadamia integrifolia]|uniref:17.3 kDa class II heat shock protein isoform X2 n=1 Tax=Macadamia integrifolia TaxID=60698 RepID=UPI001C52ABB2|nr:17.3 kDa class II heat shock protein isoform X2 [Macadamia integrifolia]
MENRVVRRRMDLIMGHFASNEDSSPNTVFPTNCSSSINSVIRRGDNRMLFARQGCVSQARFMRPQGSSVKCGTSLSCSGSVIQDFTYSSEAPTFSRPARKENNLPNIVEHHPMKQDCKLAATETPLFARPSVGLSGQKQVFSKEIKHASGPKGIERLPQMHVSEAGHNHVVTVELPGIRIRDIKVEVDDQNLIVTGQHSTQRWQFASGPDDLFVVNHMRGISRRPYRLVWPLPNNVNKDGVSAVFLDGILQITLPKL